VIISRPNTQLSGSLLLDTQGPHVYGWRRDKDYLYVGASVRILGRVTEHNIIGKREPVLATDVIDLWRCESTEEMFALEWMLIEEYRPVYNVAGVTKTRYGRPLVIKETPFAYEVAREDNTPSPQNPLCTEKRF
jgi:hypothetical protein